MSQTSKRPGARDISDLKARLGLKKSGASAPAGGAVAPPPGASAPPPPGASVAPPPGAAPAPSAIPAPPGLAPPKPVAAPIPDATTDPFGAMGAMAQQAKVAAAPEIVIINDGKPVEDVAHKNKAASIGKLVAMILGPLIIGVIIGKVSTGASQYNKVIEDAAPIKDDVKTARRGLLELQATLESGKKGGKFAPGDAELTKALAAVPTIKGNMEQLYASSLYQLDFQVEIYEFYAGLAMLDVEKKAHLRAAKNESKILQEGVKTFAAFKRLGPYGGVLKIPKADDAAAGKPVMFKFVQLGGPVCAGETRPNPGGCNGAPTGFAHRSDETGSWSVNKIAPATEEGIPTDTVVMLDPTGPLLKQLVGGGSATVAEASYKERIASIEALTARLLETGKKIETVLNAKANESGKFSFFL